VNIITATCKPQPDNVLRFACQVTTDEPHAHVAFWLTDATGDTRMAFSSTTVDLTHDFTLWGLKANATYNWEATAHVASPYSSDSRPGSFTTDALPTAVDLSLTFSAPVSASAQVEHVLFNYSCDSVSPENLVVANADGEVVWYEDVSTATFGPSSLSDPFTIRGLSVTREGTILALLDHERIVEYDLAGNRLLELARGEDFTDFVHHDVLRKNGFTAAVSAEAVTLDGVDYVMDGINLFNASGALVEDWDMSELYEAGDCVGTSTGGYWGPDFNNSAIDCMHTNSLWIDAERNWYFSMRSADSVIKVIGDPSSADVGGLAWTLDGQGLTGDFVIASSTGATTDPSFEAQHHAWLTHSGQLMLFDNKWVSRSSVPVSRAVKLALDESTQSAEILTEYVMGAHCDGQGSAFVLEPSGQVLATCPSTHTFTEFSADGTATLWSGTVACTSGSISTPPPYRGVPITL